VQSPYSINKQFLPATLRKILGAEHITKAAQGALGEKHTLQQEFDHPEISNFVDLYGIAKRLNTQPRSLQGLVGIFMKHRLQKDQRCSDWEKDQLTDAQIQYAATDAYAGWGVLKAMREGNRGNGNNGNSGKGRMFQPCDFEVRIDGKERVGSAKVNAGNGSASAGAKASTPSHTNVNPSPRNDNQANNSSTPKAPSNASPSGSSTANRKSTTEKPSTPDQKSITGKSVKDVPVEEISATKGNKLVHSAYLSGDPNTSCWLNWNASNNVNAALMRGKLHKEKLEKEKLEKERLEKERLETENRSNLNSSTTSTSMSSTQQKTQASPKVSQTKVGTRKPSQRKNAVTDLTTLCIQQGYQLKSEGFETAPGGFRALFRVEKGIVSKLYASTKPYGSIREAQQDCAGRILEEVFGK
jgi:hypothetical protein